jgi:hypothetical protein
MADYTEVRLEAKNKFQELYELTEDKHCDGCYYLQVQAPFRGPTAANIDPWRDGYKFTCNYYNKIWLGGGKKKIPKCMECILSDAKTM